MIEKYPGWRYHATRPPVIVADAEAEARLGEGWAETPFTDAPIAVSEAKPVTPSTPPDPNALTPIEERLSDEEDRRSAELHAITALEACQAIENVTDVEQLARIRDREARNPKPKGGRKVVMRAIGQRMHELLEARG